MTLDIPGQLFAEELCGRDNMVGFPESLQEKVSQTGADRIADEQCPGQYRDRSRDTNHHGQIGAPVILQTLFDELSSSHHTSLRCRSLNWNRWGKRHASSALCVTITRIVSWR